MLIISHEVLQVLKREFGKKGTVRYVDSHGDLYRLLPNGDIYVHWCSEKSPKYSKSGARIGNLLNHKGSS
jgi:hypothetical protein